MSDYKKISIDITENGYIITINGDTSNTKEKQFIFSNIKKLREWMKEHLSATGEVERFSDALDTDKKIDNPLKPNIIITPYQTGVDQSITYTTVTS